MKKKVIAALMSTMMIMSLVACGNNDTIVDSGKVPQSIEQPTGPTEPTVITEQDAENELKATSSVMNIAQLVDFCEVNDQDSNVILSETSLNMALSLVLEGAKEDSDSYSELAKFLSSYGFDRNAIRSMNNCLIQQYANNEDITIKLANSIWSDKDLPLNQQYIDIIGTYYQGPAESLDFSDSASADKINNWCANHTNGLIPEIIDAPTLATNDAVLLNALYFLGDWVEPFEDNDVEVAPFTNADGSESNVKLMSDYDLGTYYESDYCEGFMKYYNGYDIAFVGILPKNTGSFNVADLDIDTMLDNCSTNYIVNIKMPKFKIEDSHSLKDALINAGLVSIFNEQSDDFTGIMTVDEPVHVSDVIQKTYVDVNETGTEAAAVTSAMMMKNTAIDTKPKEIKNIILDRPFVFMIYDTSNKECLFMGKINYLPNVEE